MTGSGSSSRSSFPRTSSQSSSGGAGTTSAAGILRLDPSRASTSRWRSSADSLAAPSSRSCVRCATKPLRRTRSSSSPCATGRRAPSECSSSPIRAAVPRHSPTGCRVASSGSAFTCRSAEPGLHTSRSCGSGVDRGSTRLSRRSGVSLHPEPLLSFHVCTRQGRGTRSWNRVR